MNLGKLVWITGLSGAGKSTLGEAAYELLSQKYDNVVLIDGDVIREILGNDLGHCIEDRKKNAYRISKMCEFLTKQGVHVVCATMSLFREIHEYNERNIANYYEILLDVDIDILAKRDSKNIYSRGVEGKLDNVIGLDLSYDLPINPYMTIDNSTFDITPHEKAKQVLIKIGLI